MTTHFIVPRRSVRRPFPAPFGAGWDLAERLLEGPFRTPVANPFAGERSEFAPKINVSETDTELRFSAELPGLESDDFEVLVDADVLIIRGEKKVENISEGDRFRRVERSSGRFERRFKLGWEADADQLEAAYKQGVLEVVVPKPSAEASGARSIPVTAS